jgi:hypothetical protein
MFSTGAERPAPQPHPNISRFAGLGPAPKFAGGLVGVLTWLTFRIHARWRLVNLLFCIRDWLKLCTNFG